MGNELNRYHRQIILSEIGPEGQRKLQAARVLVIGAGGLGCPALQYLTAAGVGTIGIIDNDKVDVTNLHRQILFSMDDTGRNKAEAAAEKLKLLNPDVNSLVFPERLSSENAFALIPAFDLVVDGSDNFETRYLVNDACVELDKPLVFGSIFGFEGQLSVFNYEGGPTYRCIFPEPGDAPNCAINGVLGVLPGIIGCYMANEALKLILKIGDTLSGRLLVINILENSFNSFKIKRVVLQKGADKDSLPATNQPHHSDFQPDENRLTTEELDTLLETEQDSILLVDVREPNEFEADNQGGINIPLSEISDHVLNLPSDKRIVLFCSSGIRSKIAFDLFKAAGRSRDVFWVK